MTSAEIAAVYYDAWKNKAGDFAGVPLAPDLKFTGPVTSFDDAAGYRQMAAQAGRFGLAEATGGGFPDGCARQFSEACGVRHD